MNSFNCSYSFLHDLHKRIRYVERLALHNTTVRFILRISHETRTKSHEVRQLPSWGGGGGGGCGWRGNFQNPHFSRDAEMAVLASKDFQQQKKFK